MKVISEDISTKRIIIEISDKEINEFKGEVEDMKNIIKDSDTVLFNDLYPLHTAIYIGIRDA